MGRLGCDKQHTEIISLVIEIIDVRNKKITKNDRKQKSKRICRKLEQIKYGEIGWLSQKQQKCQLIEQEVKY